MKTLHNLNKLIASSLMFLKSFAGAGFVLFVIFIADLGANTFGIQTFMGERMQAMIVALGLSRKVAFIISTCFSALLSSALGLVIIQAVLHAKHVANAILSFLSVYLSFTGLAYMMLKDVTVDQLGDLDASTYVGLSIVLALALTPPIAYNMNASLVVETFGAILDKFNDASVQELDKSFDAQVNTLAQADVAKTKRQTEKELRKYGVRGSQNKVTEPEYKYEEAGTVTDYNEFINNISNN